MENPGLKSGRSLVSIYCFASRCSFVLELSKTTLFEDFVDANLVRILEGSCNGKEGGLPD